MKHYRHGLASAAVITLALHGVALAQDAPATGAPAAPAASAETPAPAAVPALPEPDLPPSQIAAARDLVIASGISRSFIPMVPQLREQITPMLTRTRPELAKDLGEVIVQLTPEFDKKTDEMIDIAAQIYARRMSEDELKQAAAFFNGPVGKKYVSVQPGMLDDLVAAMQSWTQQLSVFMMQRVRDEMIKRGHTF